MIVKFISMVWKLLGLRCIKCWNYIFSSKGPIFNKNAHNLMSSADKAVHKIQSYCHCMGQTPPVIGMKLFNSLVRRILKYGCEVWCPMLSTQIKETLEKCQLKFMKSVLRVKRQTTNTNTRCQRRAWGISLRN